LNNKVSQDNLGFTDASHQIGIHWKEIKTFAENDASLMSERKLTAVCKFVGREDIVQSTLQLSVHVPDRYKVLTLLDDETILVCLSLIEKFNDCKNVPGYLFAKAFGNDEKAVSGAILGKMECTKMLQSAAARKRITQLLKPGNFEPALLQAVEEFAVNYDKNGAVIRELWQEVIHECGGVMAAIEKLGVTRSSVANASTEAMTIFKAKRQFSSFDQQKKLIDLMRKWLKKNRGPGENDSPEQDSTQPDIFNPMPASFGVTTEDGVPFALTEEGFKQIQDIPLNALRDSLMVAVRTTRGLLNTASQIADQNSREILQEALSGEVRELDNSIQAFTDAYPKDITRLLDSQRKRTLSGISQKGTGR
jgi:hypothetical protein